MSDSGKLIGFAVVLVAALGAGYGIGTAAGPDLSTTGEVTDVDSGRDMPADHG